METVRETVENISWDSGIGWYLEDFLNHLDAVLKNIPKKFRDKAEITMDIDSNLSPRMYITYERPKTQAEIDLKREAKLAHYYRLKEELGL